MSKIKEIITDNGNDKFTYDKHPVDNSVCVYITPTTITHDMSFSLDMDGVEFLKNMSNQLINKYKVGGVDYTAVIRVREKDGGGTTEISINLEDDKTFSIEIYEDTWTDCTIYRVAKDEWLSFLDAIEIELGIEEVEEDLSDSINVMREQEHLSLVCGKCNKSKPLIQFDVLRAGVRRRICHECQLLLECTSNKV